MNGMLRQQALADLPRLERDYAERFSPPLHRRLRGPAVVLGLAALTAFGLWRLAFDPWRVLSGLGQLGTFVALMLPPTFGTTAKLWAYLHALFETVSIALLGTLLAAVLALPLGLLAAKNVLPNPVAHFLVRRSLDTVRGVDTLIWALLWINVVGLGPFAGVLAIATADLGAFGKLFSEAIEAADRKAEDGVASVGGTALERIRFGLLPQVLPVMLSQVLYFFESNTRSATIIGIVGAGGIGLHLTEQIRTLEWQHVSFLVILVLATVAAIDQISQRIRFAVIGTSRTP